MPHLGFTLLLAMLLSAILAVTGDRTGRERIGHASYVFLSAILTVVAGSWIMRFIEM
jgi:hypothetical protein